MTLFKTGTLGFSGTRAGGAQVVQFSVGDAKGGPVKAPGPTPGSYTYTYTDARLYFGSQSTFFDGMYRCANITVRATP